MKPDRTSRLRESSSTKRYTISTIRYTNSAAYLSFPTSGCWGKIATIIYTGYVLFNLVRQGTIICYLPRRKEDGSVGSDSRAKYLKTSEKPSMQRHQITQTL